jgi:hypothetical protein
MYKGHIFEVNKSKTLAPNQNKKKNKDAQTRHISLLDVFKHKHPHSDGRHHIPYLHA